MAEWIDFTTGAPRKKDSRAPISIAKKNSNQSPSSPFERSEREIDARIPKLFLLWLRLAHFGVGPWRSSTACLAPRPPRAARKIAFLSVRREILELSAIDHNQLPSRILRRFFFSEYHRAYRLRQIDASSLAAVESESENRGLIISINRSM